MKKLNFLCVMLLLLSINLLSYAQTVEPKKVIGSDANLEAKGSALKASTTVKSPLISTYQEYLNSLSQKRKEIIFNNNNIIIKKTSTTTPSHLLGSTMSDAGRGAYWYFGANAGLNFNTDPPTILTNGMINTMEGCATISNTSGNLLFSTDGINVYDNTNTLMPNGTGLLGDPSSTESSIIVPAPGNINQYYIFTVSADYSGTNTNVTFSIVDMTLNSGKGDVVTSGKNSVLLLHTDEVVTAIPASNGNYYWIVTKEQLSNSYYAYQLTTSGINTSTPVITNIGVTTINDGEGGGAIGYMKSNSAGTKIVHVYYDNVNSGSNNVDVFDFNASTGVLSNYNAVDNLATPYGCEFSPNGSLLYVASFMNTGIYQYDLTNSNAKYKVSASTTAADMQNAPNGKIYIANFGVTNLDIIANPNVVGSGCNYSANAQGLGGKSCEGGLPNIIAGLTSQGPPILGVCSSINITSSSATLLGDVTSDGGATISDRGFYYGTSSTPTTNKTTVTGTTGAMSLNISSLTANTLYYFRAYATNSNGTAYTGDYTFTTLTGSTAPSAPVATAATAITTTGFTTNWNSSATATGYYLDIATDNAFTSFVSGYNNLDVSNVTTNPVSGLSSNTTYYYRLRAYNTYGTSGNSNIITVTTNIPVPSAPVATAATSITPTGFAANWNTDATATGYFLDIATDAGFTNFVSGYNNLNVNNVLTYPVNGLSSNTTYYYQIRAYNTGGTSGNSNIITVTTNIPAPSAPVATAATSITPTGFTSNWNSSATATGYYLDVATNVGFTNFVSGYNNTAYPLRSCSYNYLFIKSLSEV